MTLHEFNILPKEELIPLLTQCCGSSKWVERMLPLIPAEDMVELLEDAEEQWWLCTEDDWHEAFTHHPEIGDISSLKEKFANTASLAAGEQSGVSGADDNTLKQLAEANKKYREKFGYIFIVSASGRSAAEILSIINERMENHPADEIKNAADEQNKITRIRIEKILE
jgi:2-oxo-4-hydroxy-4-carboxy-5-ureidoimidazoline decarboxylase